MTYRSLYALMLSVALAMPAHASHDSPATVLGSWAQLAPRLHVFKPAATVRALPASTNTALAQALAADAKAMAGRNFSALVIEDGAIVVEEYAQGATQQTPLNAYSMTKSWTALAVGEALCAGKIKSLDDPAATYAPALAGTAYGEASVRHLLSFTSGAQDPGGNGYVGIHNVSDFRAMVRHEMPMSQLIRKYGGKSRFKPGEKFIYNGLDADALSLVVRGATGMSLPAWFESTVWQKAGGEHPAGWYLDSEGNGVGEILVFATTRDFARVGLYVLDHLSDKAGDACVRAFMKDAAHPHVAKGYWGSAPSFGLGLHTGADGNSWMFGHGGQRVGIRVATGRVLATNGSTDLEMTDPTARSMLAR